MKKSIFIVVIGLVLTSVFFNYYENRSELSDLVLDNIEALAKDPDTDDNAAPPGEPGGGSGSKCSNGCSSIGWGMRKILECDCNYDHFSCCDRWGC